MKIKEVLNNIIFLPKSLNYNENISAYSLLKGSSYFEFHEAISEKDIFNALIKNPDCLSQWLVYSEDRRSTPNWYFTQQIKKGTYIVGFYPPQKDVKETEYANMAEACAAFIKKHIELMRRL